MSAETHDMGMCPHCKQDVPIKDSLTAYHDWPPFCRSVCPGSKQHPAVQTGSLETVDE